MIQDAINNIQYNVALSFDIMLPVPRVTFLNNVTPDERAELIKAGTHYVYPKMAIERMEGIEVSAMAYYDQGFKLFTVIVNDNHLLDGRKGPTLQANAVTAWAATVPLLDKSWKRLHSKIQEDSPSFQGFVCIDATLVKHKAYYRLIDFNPPEDYIKAVEALSGHRVDITIAQLESGDLKRPEGYGASLRVYAYPYDEEANYALMHEYGLDMIAEPCDDALCVKAKGPTVKKTWAELYKQIPKSPGICYRTDGDKLPRYMVNELKRGRYLE